MAVALTETDDVPQWLSTLTAHWNHGGVEEKNPSVLFLLPLLHSGLKPLGHHSRGEDRGSLTGFTGREGEEGVHIAEGMQCRWEEIGYTQEINQMRENITDNGSQASHNWRRELQL